MGEVVFGEVGTNVFVDAAEVDTPGALEGSVALWCKRYESTAPVRATGATVDEAAVFETIDESGGRATAESRLSGKVARPHCCVI